MQVYGIYAQFVDILENKWVRVANKSVFWYKNNEHINTVHSTFHALIWLFYTYWDFHLQCSNNNYFCFFIEQNNKLTQVKLCKLFVHFFESLNIFRTECLPTFPLHHSMPQLPLLFFWLSLPCFFLSCFLLAPRYFPVLIFHYCWWFIANSWEN